MATTQDLTLGGKLTTKLSASGGAGLNLPNGSNPSSPADGDVWTTTAGLFARINGATIQVAAAADLAAAVADIAANAALIAILAKAFAPSAYTSGVYYLNNDPGSPGTSNTLGNNTVRVSLWIVTATITISRLWVDYSLAGESGSKFRPGIWADSGGKPGTLVLDAGQIATDGTPGTAEATVSQTISAGAYWVGGAVQGAPTTQPTMRILSGTGQPGSVPLGTTLPAAATTGRGWSQGGVSGAFSDFTSSPSGPTATVPRIGFKVA